MISVNITWALQNMRMSKCNEWCTIFWLWLNTEFESIPEWLSPPASTPDHDASKQHRDATLSFQELCASDDNGSNNAHELTDVTQKSVDFGKSNELNAKLNVFNDNSECPANTAIPTDENEKQRRLTNALLKKKKVWQKMHKSFRIFSNLKHSIYLVSWIVYQPVLGCYHWGKNESETIRRK